MGIIKTILFSYAVVLLATCAVSDAYSAPTNSAPSLQVLIITPDPGIGYGKGIEELLQEYKIKAEISSIKKATPEFAEKYDVLIITGTGRMPDKSTLYLDYTKPLLAYGPDGCAYLGLLDLKNGWPYT